MNSKRITLTILTCLLCFCAVAQNLPNVKIEDNSGKVFSTSSLIDGKVPVLLAFWSSTCKYCIEEIDALNEAFTDIQDISCKIVCVSVDDSRSISRAKAMARSHDWNDFLLLYDINRNLYRSLNVVYIPQVFVYDKKGHQIYSHTGYASGEEFKIINIIKNNQ